MVVFLTKHTSIIARTMYPGGYRKFRASEFRFKRSGSLDHFPDDAVIFAVATEVLAGAVESLSENAVIWTASPRCEE